MLTFSLFKRDIAGLKADIYEINQSERGLFPLDMELRDAGLLKWSQRRLIPTNRAYVTAGHRNSALLGVVLVFNNGLSIRFQGFNFFRGH